MSVDDRKNAIIDYLVQYNKITTSQLAEVSGLSPTRVRVLLQELVDEGIILKVGNYRYTSYVMKQQ